MANQLSLISEKKRSFRRRIFPNCFNNFGSPQFNQMASVYGPLSNSRDKILNSKKKASRTTLARISEKLPLFFLLLYFQFVFFSPLIYFFISFSLNLFCFLFYLSFLDLNFEEKKINFLLLIFLH